MAAKRIAVAWTPEPEPVVEGKSKIYVAEPDLSAAELNLIKKTYASKWLSGRAPVVSELETEFARMVGTRYAVACNSGGSALEVMLRAIGIRPGDEVVVPSFTMIATAAAVSFVGAIPVFADCDPDTLNLNVESLVKAVTSKTKAVIAVHLYGHPCNMTALNSYCKRKGIILLEDAAEVQGAQWRKKTCGSMGFASAFGFYGNKVMIAGEGGMITTNNKKVAQEAIKYRDYYFKPGTHFWHYDLGHSYRMPALAAAVCLAQLRRLDELIAKREKVRHQYDKLLAPIADQLCSTHMAHKDVRHVWWHYWLRVENRCAIRQYMAKRGIETRPGFIPMHVQPCYTSKLWPSRIAKGGCPVAEDAGQHALLMPTHTKLKTADVKRIVDVMTEAMEKVG